MWCFTFLADYKILMASFKFFRISWYCLNSFALERRQISSILSEYHQLDFPFCTILVGEVRPQTSSTSLTRGIAN